MSNILPTEKKVAAISMLCEGNSIRSVERMTGIHRDTIMRLGVRMGEGCERIMDEKMRGLPCRLIQVDEVWGFIGMKRKTAMRQRATGEVGDVSRTRKRVQALVGQQQDLLKPISVHGPLSPCRKQHGTGL
jgi:hypothetical protein